MSIDQSLILLVEFSCGVGLWMGAAPEISVSVVEVVETLLLEESEWMIPCQHLLSSE